MPSRTGPYLLRTSALLHLSVVDELYPLVIYSCGLRPKPAMTCVFGSRCLSSAHTVFGVHVPSMCPDFRWSAECRTFWMQTTGAGLLAAKRCSLARVPMPAQDSRSAHRLLYLTAVRDDRREQEHRQAHLDTDPSLVSYRRVVGYRRSPGESGFRATRSIGECRMSLWSTMVVSIYVPATA